LGYKCNLNIIQIKNSVILNKQISDTGNLFLYSNVGDTKATINLSLINGVKADMEWDKTDLNKLNPNQYIKVPAKEK